jgi:hypothetical protein
MGLANHAVFINKEGRSVSIADSAAPIKDENGEHTEYHCLQGCQQRKRTYAANIILKFS